ncbi:MAG TPA: YetF domain-containing protein [Steroidobacteraceae bacterium]|nr:YetF domain-containing protein [Steroidobacteraceae bacterium]
MEAIIKAVAVYVGLLILFRLSGKRTLAEVSPFDLVLLLIISEAVQQALVDSDNSMTHGFLLVTTLVALNVLMSEIKLRFKAAERVLDGTPLLIVANGRPIPEHMRKERVDVADVLDTARETQGLESLEQIRFAVLERNGKISIIPTEEAR